MGIAESILSTTQNLQKKPIEKRKNNHHKTLLITCYDKEEQKKIHIYEQL